MKTKTLDGSAYGIGEKRAVHFAAQQGNTGALTTLLELGGAINGRDREGMTPFLYAAKG